MSWRREQGQEKFFRRAKTEGYRARSAYKLLEICDRFRLLRPGEVVVDLGAAPGSWSQVAAERVGPSGTVVAVDLQPIQALQGVRSVVGDVRDVEAVAAAVGQTADAVLSDVAPNVSGIVVTDQARAIELASSALAVATRLLRPGGVAVIKVFRGEDFDGFLNQARDAFAKVNVVIPRATRVESREAYVVGRGKR